MTKMYRSGRPVISNSSYLTENISSFLDFHLKPLSQKVKSYIKDTNDFLKKTTNLSPLPDYLILWIIFFMDLYPNIPHKEGLIVIRKALDTRKDQTVPTDSLIKLTECVLKHNIFDQDNSTFKQPRGTAIGTKMSPPYAVIFTDSQEGDNLSNIISKPLIWWCCIDDIFMMWEEEL